ncbi:MAG TPA: regulatory protein RecX [Firmicutes bacterium]|nr:regulatory protein RecX [Bacillota bacterium]
MVAHEACLTVTDLRKVPRRREYELHLSDGSSLKILEEDLHCKGIDVGSELTWRTIEDLRQAYAYKRCMEIVQRLLRIRPRTRREIIRKLQKTGFPQKIWEAVIGDLESRGVLDDLAFARLWIEEKSGKAGKRRIRSELLARGIDMMTVEQALELYYDESNTLDVARQVVERRLGRLKGLPRETVFRRLYTLLLRRGFESDVAAEVARSALENLEGKQ